MIQKKAQVWVETVIYILIGLSIAIFFPFYELKGGVHISYLVKTAVFISVLTLPFALKIIDFNLIINLYNNLKHRNQN